MVPLGERFSSFEMLSKTGDGQRQAVQAVQAQQAAALSSSLLTTSCEVFAKGFLNAENNSILGLKTFFFFSMITTPFSQGIRRWLLPGRLPRNKEVFRSHLLRWW